MNPIECRERETREWLAKAAGDLASAQLLFAGGQIDNALYHCQQCAEKSLKGFLAWHEQPFRRTHDLEELGAACVSLDPSFGPIAEEADALTDFAWRSRYPGNPYVLAAGEVVAMLDLAKRVLAQVQSRLPAVA